MKLAIEAAGDTVRNTRKYAAGDVVQPRRVDGALAREPLHIYPRREGPQRHRAAERVHRPLPSALGNVVAPPIAHDPNQSNARYSRSPRARQPAPRNALDGHTDIRSRSRDRSRVQDLHDLGRIPVAKQRVKQGDALVTRNPTLADAARKVVAVATLEDLLA